MLNKLRLYSAAALLTIGLASNAQNITRLRTDGRFRCELGSRNYEFVVRY